MSDLIFNNAIALDPLAINLYGDQDQALGYINDARALLGSMRALHGITAESPGFYQLDSVLGDGTRIVVTSNSGICAADIFVSAGDTGGQQETTRTYDVEETTPCDRASMRRYNLATTLTAPADGAYFSTTFPIINPEPASAYTYVDGIEFFYGKPVNGFSNTGAGDAVLLTPANPCFYDRSAALSAEAGHFIAASGYGFSCQYSTITVNVPASSGTSITPPSAVQFVGASRIAITYQDQNGNSRGLIIKNDANFTTDSTIVFPEQSVGNFGYIDFTHATNGLAAVQTRAILVDGSQQRAIPIQIDLNDIEYETSPATYSQAGTPGLFRYSDELGDRTEAMDFSQDRFVYRTDAFPDGPRCVTQTNYWTLSSGNILSSLDDEGNTVTWTITDPKSTLTGSDAHTFTPLEIAHDRACDCIVGVAMEYDNLGNAVQFVFFVIDESGEGLIDVAAAIPITVDDFLPSVLDNIGLGQVFSLMAAEGIAAMTFGGSFQELQISASVMIVAEYCAPDDAGKTSKATITEQYVDGNLVGAYTSSAEINQT